MWWEGNEGKISEAVWTIETLFCVDLSSRGGWEGKGNVHGLGRDKNNNVLSFCLWSGFFASVHHGVFE